VSVTGTESQASELAKNCRLLLSGVAWEDDERRVFIGTVFGLDPCGRYHHPLGMREIPTECERFWDELGTECERLGMFLSGGDGDPCDQFVGEARFVFRGDPAICEHGVYGTEICETCGTGGD
jgi:hypothetical protein